MNDGTALVRSVLLWGVPIAIVVAALAYETDWGRDVGHDVPVTVAATPQPVAVSLLPEYRIGGGVEARKDTVERVLFNPTRKPAPAAAQAAGAKPAAQHGLYALTGTTVIGNVATAFLREINGGKSHTVHQGETLNGLVVAEVKPDHVQLKQGDDVEDLPLKLASGPRTTVQTAPVVAAAQPTNPAAAVAAAAAAGGTGVAALNRSTRPVAPPPAAAQGAAAPRAGVVSVGELLAERRRAARAAAESAAAPRAQP